MFFESEPVGGEPVATNVVNPSTRSRRFASSSKPVEHSGALQRFGDLYAGCDVMKRLFTSIERLAPTFASVMIVGESGSGKELVAARVHELSDRRNRPFIAINCGAIAENLIESEFFGHERGSFTGASRTHRGCFERADGGTLFLDEVTEMPMDLQVRLLRVLETGRFCRVGGSEEIATNVRIIAATNRDPEQAVAEHKLRADLLYRLCVIPLSLPPLRARGNDSLLLAELFLAELNAQAGEAKTLSPDAKRKIAAYRWPGNVRELKNAVYRAFVMADGCVDIDLGDADGEDSTPNISAAADGSSVRIGVGTSLQEAERAIIMATLASVRGCKSRAAQVLGVSLKTLYNRLNAYAANTHGADAVDRASSIFGETIFAGGD